MDLVSSLNENQKNAVEHTEGPLLILAGAGSGKTRVITHRIAQLIHNNGVRPYNIFAVTFTNKAAGEMKERITSLIGPQGNSVFVKTFHSASVYILRRYGELIGIPSAFTIYDQSDQEQVLKRVLVEMRLDPKKIKPSMLASKISEIKDKASLVQGVSLSSLIPDYFSFDFEEIYTQYHKELTKANALDFNDLLIKTVELLRNSPEVLQRLQTQWHYFMVDEYQDTNYAQYIITKMLAAHSKNICVVGDDDQSIYSWRGADIRNILNFEEDYPDAMVITLEENYRSSQEILKTASSVIENNLNRKEKKVVAVRGEGEVPIWCQTNNEYGESEFVINTILSHKNREGLKNKDFAIFYRTNAQSRVFEDYLRKENIPYRVVGGLKFYDRKEIKDTLAYLKFIVNPNDVVSLMRVINTPARGIGKASVDRISEIAKEENIVHWKVIEDDLLTGRVPKGLASFRESIISLRKASQNVPDSIKLSKFCAQVLDLSGYRKMLEEENSIESQSRLENIDEFLNSIYDYEVTNPAATIEEFIQEISLLTTAENPNNEANESEDPENTVTLMTVHNAKGLEYPVVFLTGLEENTFPHKLSIDTEEGVEEERRLCYVGITRAMDNLYMTSADLRRTFVGIDYKEPSRFLREIPQELLDVRFHQSENLAAAGPSRRSSFSSYSSSETKKTIEPVTYQGTKTFDSPLAPKTDKAPSDSQYKVNEQVVHPKYGVGLIRKIEGSGDNLKLTILFGGQKKTFMEKYTPLERLQ